MQSTSIIIVSKVLINYEYNITIFKFLNQIYTKILF